MKSNVTLVDIFFSWFSVVNVVCFLYYVGEIRVKTQLFLIIQI